MIIKTLKKIFRISLTTMLIVGVVYSDLPHNIKVARAANTEIRQEINILNGYLGSASGAFATSSEIIHIDTNAYTGATYYFEIVASTTSAVSSNIRLRSATSSATLSTITFSNSNTYTIYRSAAFTPTPGENEYVVVTGNEAVQKGLIAARVVILQDTVFLEETETQIEIGNRELAKVNTTSSALTSPKYWYYDSSLWDANLVFTAEVTYKNTQTSSTTVYTTPGTFTYVPSVGESHTVVELWGAGGAGGVVGNSGGGGGGGGAYARSTTTTSGNKTLVVAATTAADSTTSNDSTWGTTIVVADGGTGTGTASAGAGGTLANTVGEVEFAGGAGAAGNGTGDSGGGGGSSAGPLAAGNDGTAANTTQGGAGASCNALNGGATGGTADTNDATAPDGGNGGSNVSCGAGGGGGDNGDFGGLGGSPGGGGGGGEITGGQTGARGQARIKAMIGTVGVALEEDNGSFSGWTFKKQIVTAGVATTTSDRVSVSFTPTTGRNYRIVASTTNASAPYDIYSAKIVVQQNTLEAWNVSTAVYDSQTTGITSDPSLQAIAFSSDGTKMYLVGGNSDLRQYTLDPAWDVSTAVYASKSLNVSTQDNQPQSLRFSSDGTEMYLLGVQNDRVYQYTLSTPWDLATASYSTKNLSVTSQESGSGGLALSTDGTKLYVVGVINRTIYQYTLSTPWDVSTGSYASKSLSISGQETIPTGVDFSSDGTKAYIIGNNSDTVFQYTLGTAWDISTGSYSSLSLNITSTGEGFPNDIAFDPDGSYLYIVGATLDEVLQYNLYYPSGVTALEPQYLLANTLFRSGTSLQNFLTTWNPDEWTTGNTYNFIHEGNSDIKIQNTSGPTDVTGSSITDVIQREQSSAMTMPVSAATLDVIATTNNSDLYASRILVRVVYTPPADTEPDAPTSLDAVAGYGRVNLTWVTPASDGGDPITGYKVYRDTTTSPTTLIGTLGVVNSYWDGAVTNGTLYYYRVKATNSIGDSVYSNEDSATPLEAPASSSRSNIKFVGPFMKFVGGRIKFN
jgi:hypothetical protein